MGAGQPDVQAYNGGFGHEANGQQTENPRGKSGGDIGQRCNLETELPLCRQSKTSENRKRSTQRKQDVGKCVWFGIFATQDQEIGPDGQGLPSREEFKRLFRNDKHCQPCEHQHC